MGGGLENRPIAFELARTTRLAVDCLARALRGRGLWVSLRGRGLCICLGVLRLGCALGRLGVGVLLLESLSRTGSDGWNALLDGAVDIERMLGLGHDGRLPYELSALSPRTTTGKGSSPASTSNLLSIYLPSLPPLPPCLSKRLSNSLSLLPFLVSTRSRTFGPSERV